MIKVKVPASSANIGPGFDCLGLAVSLYNDFQFSESDRVELVGFKEEFVNDDNLVLLAAKYIYEQANVPFPGLKIEMKVKVPEARGLGSSTTCIVGGMLGANALLDEPFTFDEIFEFATRMEGHPDNVAPAMYGGLSTSYMDDTHILSSRIPIADGIKLMALIPDFSLSTEKARAVLPKEIAYKTAVHNASRIAMLIAALHSGKTEHLKIALQDEMHQPYRGPLIKHYETLMPALIDLDIYGAYLSGAGPTIMVMLPDEETIKNEVIKLVPKGWQYKELDIVLTGAEVYGA